MSDVGKKKECVDEKQDAGFCQGMHRFVLTDVNKRFGEGEDL